MVGLTLLGKNEVITVSPMDSTGSHTMRYPYQQSLKVSRAAPKRPCASIAIAFQIQMPKLDSKQASTAVE